MKSSIVISRGFIQAVTGMIALLPTFIIFQNMKPTQDVFGHLTELKFKKVSTEIRRSHATELLGSKYKKSQVEETLKLKNYQDLLFKAVQNELPAQYRNRAQMITQTILKESQKYEMDPAFVFSIIKTESRFNPNAKGSKGEIGLMQLMPETARYIAGKGGYLYQGPKTLRNPVYNIKLGVRYISYLREKFSGHATKYVSAYNMGPTNVNRLYKKAQTPRLYATRVMKEYRDLYSYLVSQAGVASN